MTRAVLPIGLLGLFAAFAYSWALLTPSPYHPLMCGIAVVAGALMACGAWIMNRGLSKGWWLCWLAMFLAASLGLFQSIPIDSPVPPAFFAFFMVAASGFFFRDLANPAIYPLLFQPEDLPHAAFGSMPGVLVLLGAVGMASSGEIGMLCGGAVVAFSALFFRWMFSPIASAVRRRAEWHAA